MSRQFGISVVVPCHNSEIFLEQTIAYLHSELRQDEELILVENGSTDNTWKVLSKLFGNGRYPNVTVMQSEKGLGLALRYGIERAQGEAIVFMEDDLPFGLQELELARKLDVKNKYLILSKYHGNIKGIGLRKIQGLIFIFLRETVLGLRVKDSQATFLGDAQIVKRLISASRQNGFLITLELIALARKTDTEIIEIPCDSLAKPIRPTTLVFSDVLGMFFGLFQVKRSLKRSNKND